MRLHCCENPTLPWIAYGLGAGPITRTSVLHAAPPPPPPTTITVQWPCAVLAGLQSAAWAKC